MTKARYRSTSTGAIGEFTVPPAFLPREIPRPVLFAAGLPTGYQVSDRNKTKIWAHQYVDFQDILFNSTSEQTYTKGKAPTLQFAPQKKLPLTETEWCTARDSSPSTYRETLCGGCVCQRAIAARGEKKKIVLHLCTYFQCFN